MTFGGEARRKAAAINGRPVVQWEVPEGNKEGRKVAVLTPKGVLHIGVRACRAVLWIRNDFFRIRSRIRIRIFREFRIRSGSYSGSGSCMNLYESAYLYVHMYTHTYIHTHTHYCLYVTNIYTIVPLVSLCSTCQREKV